VTAVITAPGVYELPEDVYHRDPVEGGSLSTSAAKVLLDCPAKYRYQQEHPRPPKKEFDLGHVAHKLVLGVGAEIVKVDADDWRTKVAKEARAEAYTAGRVPVLAADYARAEAMAAAIRGHRTANALLNPDHGKPEQSLFWRDDETGIMRRARLDWLPSRRIKGRLVVPDVKTASCSSVEAIQRSVWNFRYFLQADAYLDAVRSLGLDDDPAFLFVVVEVEPPHVVTIVELDEPTLAAGHAMNRKAIDLFAKCRANDEWPGYTSRIEMVGLPAYAQRQLDEEL
jgi:hypothetical protein